MEIGSEFWLDILPEQTSVELPGYLKRYGDIALTASGSSALTLLLRQIQPKSKTALLPAYICESVIEPFLEEGYVCHYYEVDENLMPDIESIKSRKEVGVFLHLGYFGFPVNANLSDVLAAFKRESVLIIEDVTHSLFSNYELSRLNDFYIGSIRKWLGVPSGGFLAASTGKLDASLEEDFAFANKRLAALLTKGEYIRTKNMELKTAALRKISEAEQLLKENFSPWQIDGLSMEIISALDAEELKQKRKSNYLALYSGIQNIQGVKPLFALSDERVCPLFFPVMIKKEERGRIRGRLTEEGIYCPIHWPLPPQLETEKLGTTKAVFDEILSIPCDQRYGEDDMKRIVSVLESIS
ncbi:hypothetical protein M4S82_04140 [Planococcus sp. MERTA32b]|nr:hypothetical protein [Planococcus sp. MER TA 32b]